MYLRHEQHTETLRSSSSNAIAALFLDFLTFSRSFFFKHFWFRYIRTPCYLHQDHMPNCITRSNKNETKAPKMVRNVLMQYILHTIPSIPFHSILTWELIWLRDIEKKKRKHRIHLSQLSVLCNEMLWKWRLFAYLVRLFLLGKGYSKSFLFLAIR